jgi:type II secretory pathway pseudopilin PulG
MSTQAVVAVVSAVVALLGAVVAGLMTTWSAQRTRRYESLLDAQQRALSKAEQAEAVLGRYRDPILAAAHNLSKRLYNIVDMSYLAVYLHCGEADQERYARDYTECYSKAPI